MCQQMGIEAVRGQLTGCGFQLGSELVDNLLSVAWSPRGVALLVSSRQLGLCVEYMWQRMRGRGQAEKRGRVGEEERDKEWESG